VVYVLLRTEVAKAFAGLFWAAGALLQPLVIKVRGGSAAVQLCFLTELLCRVCFPCTLSHTAVVCKLMGPLRGGEPLVHTTLEAAAVVSAL